VARELDDQEIISLVESEINGSSDYLDSEVSAQQATAMEYFYGEPFGNEEDGRSQVVVTDVQDTLMWMMPSLMRIFTAGEKVVKFIPEGPEDEETADQATNYINHVFYKQNDGFMILYNMFLDALMQKVGVVKHYWEDIESTTTESYENLTEQEFSLLEQDEELDLIEHTESIEITEVPDPTTGQAVELEIVTHDVTYTRTTMAGKVTIENVPPEEFLINRGAKTLDDARFICHRSHKSRSDLIKMGYDQDVVDDLPGYTAGADDLTTSQEYMARHFYDSTSISPNQAADDSEVMIMVNESYMKLDMDGSGVSVMHKILSSGSEVLDCEPIDYIPFSSVCPIPIPHKFYGLSVAETVQDIQLIRSTLTRNLLDNMYLANNGRFQIVEGQVNVDDLLTSRPGGIVRTRSLNALQPIQTPALQPAAFQMLQYWDDIKTGRTGVNPQTQGLSADVLKTHVTTGAVTAALSSSQGRLELIARVFADTGVRNMFKQIYNLVQRYENRKKLVRLNNTYVSIDPSSWREDMDVNVEVGIGYGDQDIKLQNISNFASLIEKVGTQTEGIVSADNVYNLVREIADEMGIKNVDKFVSKPPQPEPRQPSVQEQTAQAQAQAMLIQAQSSQLAAEVKAKELEIKAAKLELERVEVEHDMAMQREELKLKGIELGFEMNSDKNIKA
jgi:hypothetical protein|tara:strand:+ start:1030 stop:3051 length:2022 start_codon:yes stop_codon:yes gene_type:complete